MAFKKPKSMFIVMIVEKISSGKFFTRQMLIIKCFSDRCFQKFNAIPIHFTCTVNGISDFELLRDL